MQTDAILDRSEPTSNPPFLGGKLLRNHLGDAYVNDLFKLWGMRVRPEADQPRNGR